MIDQQHNHHCLLSFKGYNWWIIACRPNQIDVARDIPGAACARLIYTIETSQVDWPVYCESAVAWDRRNYRRTS